MNLHHDTITVHGRTDECQKLIKNKQGGVRTVRHGGMEEQV